MTDILAIPKFCKDCDFCTFRTTDLGHGSDYIHICKAEENTILKYDLVTGEITRRFNTCEQARVDNEISGYRSCGVSALWFKDKITEVTKRIEAKAIETSKPKDSFTIGTNL